jgi:peroxiredoxin
MDEIAPLSAGTLAPDFVLTDVLSQTEYRLSELRGQLVILDFWSVECPWSRKFDDYFLQRAIEWSENGVALLFIASNDNEATYEMQDLAEELGITNPILVDSGNSVADAYGAQTTPHVFVLDTNGEIVYQGAVDDRSFRQQEATVNYLDEVVDALLAGEIPGYTEMPAYGCALVRHFDD